MLDLYRQKLLKLVQDEAQNLKMQILTGGLSEADYKFMCGVLRGLDLLADFDDKIMENKDGEDESLSED